MNAESTAKGERFLALDSCRGLCACLVAWYHFNRNSGALIEHSYLFVDFFFVLSGFVIAHSYLHRVGNASQFNRFIIMRLGRVYPLHIFMLCAYIALESLKLIPAIGAMSNSHAFASNDRSLTTIASNVFLIHSLGIHNFLTWNRPSWSISTELWCYVLFGMGAMWGLVKRPLLAAVAIVGVAVIYFWSPRLMDTTYDFGLIRCASGFSVGVLCQMVYAALRGRRRSPDTRYATACEVFSTAGALAFVVVASDKSGWTVLAPMAFAPAVTLLAFEGGWVSRVLRHSWLQVLGLLSYSIYMTHGFVKDLSDSCVVFLEHTQHVTLSTMVEIPGVGLTRVMGISRASTVAASLAMLVLTVMISALTYRYVEAPFRKRSRQLADQLGSSSRPCGTVVLLGQTPSGDEAPTTRRAFLNP
jgi:peptidoglycan/LPS O-acetylase OafA/YrhL